MTLDTIRRTIQRAFERLNQQADPTWRQPASARPRDRGLTLAPDEAALLQRPGFAQEALPWMNAVYRFALRLTRNDDSAQDLVQETYLRAYRGWSSFDSNGSDRRKGSRAHG